MSEIFCQVLQQNDAQRLKYLLSNLSQVNSFILGEAKSVRFTHHYRELQVLVFYQKILKYLSSSPNPVSAIFFSALHFTQFSLCISIHNLCSSLFLCSIICFCISIIFQHLYLPFHCVHSKQRFAFILLNIIG